MTRKRIFLVLRIIIALILIQTLRFKFTAHPDSVYIFETAGLEPYGRIGTGIVELIAGILILIPRTIWLGASLTLGVLAGAIFTHLTRLGIEVNQDGGLLFITAVVTFVMAAIVFLNHWRDIPGIKKKI